MSESIELPYSIFTKITSLTFINCRAVKILLKYANFVKLDEIDNEVSDFIVYLQPILKNNRELNSNTHVNTHVFSEAVLKELWLAAGKKLDLNELELEAVRASLVRF